MSNNEFKETEIGMIPKEWEVMKLNDFLYLNPKRSVKKGDKVKFVAMADVKEYTKNISSYIIKEFKGGSKFKNNDTLMARITPCLENGKTAFVDFLKENEIGAGSTEFIVLSNIENVSNSNYIYYLSISNILRDKAIKSMVGSSGRQRVQNDVLADTKIAVPPLPEQKAIAKILSDLDEKIENNKKINENLEEVGKALFKEWFVDFEFPSGTGKPYKSSGGKMIESELGMIPKEWEIKKLKDISKIVCGKTPLKNIKENFGEDFLFIKIPDMHNNAFIIDTEDKLSKIGNETQKGKLLPKGAINVSCIATVGLVSITSLPSHTNQQINSLIINKEEYRYFLYLKLKYMKRKLEDMGSGGSATLNVNTSSFSNIEIILPNNVLLKQYHNIIEPVFNEIEQNVKEIQSLQQTRDALLSKLMKGEVRVK